MKFEDDEAPMIEGLEAFRAPLLGPGFTEQVLTRVPLPRGRRGGWVRSVVRTLAAAALLTHLALVLILVSALASPSGPTALAPRVILYWAGLPDFPGPLDGGL